MLASCSRAAGRQCQRIAAESSSAAGNSHRFQQQWTRSIHDHVKGLKRPTRASLENDDLDMGWNRPEPLQVETRKANTAVANFNRDLAKMDRYGRIIDAYAICFKMKILGILPDRTTYDHLLSLCAHHVAPQEALGILEDMAAMGIPPDRSAFHYVIRALDARDMRGVWDILQAMQSLNVKPDERTFDLVITRVLENENLELALQYMALMSTRGITPMLNTATRIIRAASTAGLPNLALEIARNFEFVSIRRLDGETWMECLIASASALYYNGVQETWQKCVTELNIIPDEGCCIQVLNTAARAGKPQLALDVIRVLQSQNVTWEEYHFAPLVEAFCEADEIKEAFEVLGTMQKYNVTPTSGTAGPIMHAVGKHGITLDQVWSAVDALREEGKVVDVTALNVVLRAAIQQSDLQRALGIYKAFPEFNTSYNVDTFNILLNGCVRASHRELGDRLLTEMKELGIKPNVATYKRVISLCLTQATYEDAFFYLEEMKAAGFIPPRTVYDLLIRKCVSMGDSRYQLAVEEMHSQGYQMTEGLKHFIDTGGQRQEGTNPHPDRLASASAFASSEVHAA